MVTPSSLLDLSFVVDAVENGEVRRVPFKDLLGAKTLVSVYMRNNTGSCDKQINSLAQGAAAWQAKGVTVIGVSRDKASSHVKYAQKQGVAFVLVSDPDDLFSQAADAIVEKSMYGKKYLGPARAAYLLNRKGAVLKLIEKVDPAQHGEQIEALLAEK
jgi:peroxiredoxin Q/BCP